MIKWPADLVEDISRRQCVIVLGSGVSMNSTNDDDLRPKGWREFLESAVEGVEGRTEIRRLIKFGDYLTACELIKSAIGRDDFNRLIRDEFLQPRFKAADIHKHIYNLDSRIVITPNFDKIYDTYAQATSDGTVIIKKFNDADIAEHIRTNGRVIIKIHGSVDAADDLIFSRKDYSEARIKHRDFYQIINALSLTHTFIFIGCGTNDPDIRLILEDYSFKYKRGKCHYIIMPKGSIHKSVLGVITDIMALKPLLYDPKEHHKLLSDSLAELVGLVEIKRSELAESRLW